jgi:hypothetical protein
VSLPPHAAAINAAAPLTAPPKKRRRLQRGAGCDDVAAEGEVGAAVSMASVGGAAFRSVGESSFMVATIPSTPNCLKSQDRLPSTLQRKRSFQITTGCNRISKGGNMNKFDLSIEYCVM